MNRTFKTVVGWWYWTFIIMTSVLLFYFFWMHYLVLAAVMALFAIYEIEMLIHTQYVLTSDGRLIIETGRFVKNLSIEISHIESITKIRSMSLWQPSLSPDRLEIKFSGKSSNLTVHISPQNEEAFIDRLKKMNSDINII